MSGTVYKKLKKQNGERFARTLRDHHNGLLEIPDIDKRVRHAGRGAQDAQDLLPYLMSLLAANDNPPAPPKPEDPFSLLEQAGYDAFHADTLKKQNSIRRYFQKGELLCTFNDSARYKDYHIVHAVKKDVDAIKRADFRGREARQDEYGTSVISIQMLKTGGFISIKNRYNHRVSGCDHTFGSNPDNIIDGLSEALKAHFNVEFSAGGSLLPDGYIPVGEQVFKYNIEENNIYYGDQAWAQNGQITAVDRGRGDALFDRFLFDNQTKTLKNIDPASGDSFADDFNRCYGGNRGLCADKQGNLTLNGDILIGAENSRIRTLNLHALTTMSDRSLFDAPALTYFEARALTAMGDYCLFHARTLEHFDVPALTTMGDRSLFNVPALTHFEARALASMGDDCLCSARTLERFDVPALTTMGDRCLHVADVLEHFEARALTSMGDDCLFNAYALTHLDAPALTSIGDGCLVNAHALKRFEAPALTDMGDDCLRYAYALTHLDAPALTTMGLDCLHFADALVHFEAPAQLYAGLQQHEKLSAFLTW